MAFTRTLHDVRRPYHDSHDRQTFARIGMAFAPFDLTGKVAVITGGNSGIGLGMAHGIAQAGGDVCIWGTNAAKNSAAVEQLAIHGTRISAQRCDVADGDAVAAAFAATIRDAWPRRRLLRQRRRRGARRTVRSDAVRRLAARHGGQPRRRVSHVPPRDGAHAATRRSRRSGWSTGRDREPRRDLRANRAANTTRRRKARWCR